MSLKQPLNKDLDNINLTAFRIITIFNMLLENYCDDKDINERLLHDNIETRSLSRDTICIYINTLRATGCHITRPSKKNNYKYGLIYHPFKILDDKEIDSIIKAKKYISSIADWKLMINLDKTFCSIMENLTPECKKKFDQVRKDCLKHIDINSRIPLIITLEKSCIRKNNLLISYFSPESGEKFIKMSVDKLCYENSAIYLWGYNIESEELQCLRVDRIKNIELIEGNPCNFTPKILYVTYKLTGISASIFIPNENETILDQNEDSIIVKSKIKSKFKFIQKVLSFGNNCIVLSPESIRKEIIAKLQSMRLSYEYTKQMLL